MCSVFEPPARADLAGSRWDPIGGMQFSTGQLTRALARLDVQQTVITAYVPGGPRKETRPDGVTVHRLGWAVPLWRQLYWGPAAPLLLRAARNHDLVHVHLGEDLAVLPLALTAARFGGVPLVLTIHCSLRRTLAVSDIRSAVLHTAGGWLEYRATVRAAATITLTEHLRDALLADGADPGRVFTIPSGFDPKLFSDDSADPFPDVARPRVAFVGRLAAQKGVRSLIEAVPRITAAKGVLIVGDGPQRHELQTLAAQIGDRRLRFTGFVPHETVAAVLAHVDALVLPSEYEELGSVLVEGMAAGAPIVATAVGGIPELLDHGGAGILVPPRDPAGLAQAIDRILTDPALSARLRTAGRRRAEMLSWDSLAGRILEVYAGVVRDQA